MSDNKDSNNPPEKGLENEESVTNIAVLPSDVSSVTGSVKTSKTSLRASSSSDRQIKFEKAQRCLENAALVSKRIKEHRKATAELLGKPFEEDDAGDTASEVTTASERTGYSVATTASTTLSVQDALNIPGISESLANTLKQKEILMERIKQYKEISKRPIIKSSPSRRESTESRLDTKTNTKSSDTASNVQHLNELVKDKENALSIMQVKMRMLETTIIDLQEKISEKDQIIEAKNMATTLMSDNISKKEKDSLDLLEDTRQQMTKMQENFIAMETEWKEEKQKLLDEIKAKDNKISSLEEANSLLETARFDISVEHSKLAQELELKSKQISQLEEELQKLSENKHVESVEPTGADLEKGSLEISNMEQLTKKIELLENLNCQIRQTNKELENKLASISSQPSSPSRASPSKKGSPLPTRKGGKNTKMKSPWSNMSSESIPQEVDKKQTKTDTAKTDTIVQALNKEILDKEYVIAQQNNKLTELEKTLSDKDLIIKDISEAKSKVQVVDAATEPEIEITSTEVIHQEAKCEEENLTYEELQQKLVETEKQITILNNDLNLANKNMVKVKLEHKTKLKQMQKTIDHFSKVSDSNAEVIKLNEEIHKLSQKVAELEEEKGNLQLHLVDYDSGRMTESDTYKKLLEVEALAESRLKAISILEAQKFDLVQELHELQKKNEEIEDKLADISQMQTEQVSSEITSVQLEEEIDKLTASKKELELIIDNLKLDKEQLINTISRMEQEKEDISHKLEQCIHENMELTDKLEKLSAEKVSSAESIEIVESLTTQEKLELEEYNKGLSDNKTEHMEDIQPVQECSENIEQLVLESEELNRKIELFTQERQEVMEKMAKINVENEVLQHKINDMNLQTESLQSKIDMISKEKVEVELLNVELNKQIEDLKRERIEVMKSSVDSSKVPIDETAEVQEEKSVADKANNRNKSVKQLTKDILKLKNTIKEREEEIADCQMKILSLEEQQQKHSELLQTNASYEAKIRSLCDENALIKEQLGISKNNKESENQLIEFQEKNTALMQEVTKIQQEYTLTINTRDQKIQELENILVEYEKQIHNYGNVVQQKDKELSEYINQVTKLNEVSQKLKSTIELLEEENAELVKSLNKKITTYEKKLAECEERLRVLEEEKSHLLQAQGTLENRNKDLEMELKNMQETLASNQIVINDFETQHKKHVQDMMTIAEQAKEKDEEIHEIKLELRKESIENEKLRDQVQEKGKVIDGYIQELADLREKLDKTSLQTDESNSHNSNLETKNKELMEKLKKFALNLKKKNTMYAELETQYLELQSQQEKYNLELEQLNIQLDTLPHIREKLSYAEEEINRLLTLKAQIEQDKNSEISKLLQNNQALEQNVLAVTTEIGNLRQQIHTADADLKHMAQENQELRGQIDALNKKIAELEVEQKNSVNIVTKIAGLENDVQQKQAHINELLSKVNSQEQLLSQVQYGQEAKLQERDVYIESLETEIAKYKSRIGRLEESVSNMEERRQSVEKKADQLDSQLQEKQKAYSEYTHQEDELVGRLAALMDHDRVLERQIHEIESENRELLMKIHQTHEDNQHLKKSLSEIQELYYATKEKADRTDLTEAELANNQQMIRELDMQLKKLTHDHQQLLTKSRKEIEELESEFNLQIENALKEKKILSDRHEKLNEHVVQLEQRVNEYKTNINNLNANLHEMTQQNQALRDKTDTDKLQTPDYTEQYIAEINRLNAAIHHGNQSFEESMRNSQAAISSLESKISQVNERHVQTSAEIDKLISENSALQQANKQLQNMINQKDDQIQMMAEKKKVSFEMNIPKTEGLIISSTIEALEELPQIRTDQPVNIASLESQILSQDQIDCIKSEKVITPKKSEKLTAGGEVLEPVIKPKEAYLCYKGEADAAPEVEDPFNSDEGWGFGETVTEPEDVMPGFTHFNAQITQLQNENDVLKADLAANNTKLIKALKKLKELKSNNEVLSNELRISKQLSQSSLLDNAIEDELQNNIQELEKRVQELQKELKKEKQDKESLAKQNEVFKNAHERMTDMKEKLDNEIEMWKYKFKQANDKLETVQWEGEVKPSTEKIESKKRDVSEFTEDISKIEKENEELMALCDQLTQQNNELSIKQSQANEELNSLRNQLQESKNTSHDTYNLNNQILELQNKYSDLQNNYDLVNKQFSEIDAAYKDLNKSYNSVKSDHDKVLLEKDVHMQQILDLQNNNVDLQKKMLEIDAAYNELNQKYDTLKSEYDNKLIQKEYEIQQVEMERQHLEEQCQSFKIMLDDLNAQLNGLRMENDNLKLNAETNTNKIADSELVAKLQFDLESSNSRLAYIQGENGGLKDALSLYEQEIQKLKTSLQTVTTENETLHASVSELKAYIETSTATLKSEQSVVDDSDLQRKLQSYEQQIQEQSIKISQLNSENDQLLSTVAELRSSVATAVDQRGFEIAELWKQHLAQREAEFQKLEHDLRSQLSASETRYESLLDNVQSSSQEETNNLIMAEQLAAIQNKLQDKENHLLDLQSKYADSLGQLDILRSDIDDEKLMLENKLLSQQEEYEKITKDLKFEIDQLVNERVQKEEELQNALVMNKDINTDLQTKNNELAAVVKELEGKIDELSQQLHMKNIEINQKAQDLTLTLAQRNEEFENVRKQLLDFEKKVEDLTFEKESELAVLRLKMHESQEDFNKMQAEYDTEKQTLTEALNSKILECAALNRQIIELNQALEDNSSKSLEMQTALENQELEIVTLKDEIEHLNLSLRASNSKMEKHVTFSSDTKTPEDDAEQTVTDELLDAVPRAELDLALYMLHQRDVRCEELTMELTQLLEERDTLQLRLSDSLRSQEELKFKCQTAGLDISSSSQEVVELPTFSVEREQTFVDTHRATSSRSSSVSEVETDKTKLHAKLSELRGVRQSRDVRLLADSTERQAGLRLMQRDVASLPPQAVERLHQAHHTLARDSQSTPTVLLNWLRGKSTPKVVHM